MPYLDEMFYGDDILCYPSDPSKWEIYHDVSVLGWGETASGEKYWQVRNSWSTAYGENGFFKVCRGNNNMKLEQDCTWVTPEV